MPQPHTTPPIPLDIPILGVNKIDPLQRMNSMFCPWLLNFNPETQYLKARRGYVIHSDPDYGDKITQLMNFGNESLFAYVASGSEAETTGELHKIYDVSTDTPTVAASLTGTTGGTQNDSVSFHNGLGIFLSDADVDQARQYDGSSWATFGFATEGALGHSYKGRYYFTQGGDITNGIIEYGGLGAVAGATTEWDVSELFMTYPLIFCMETLSSPKNVPTEQYFVLGNGDGEILVFAGDYPDAPNWEQIAEFKVPRILSSKAVIKVNNDIFIATEIGVVSIRKLFENNGDIYGNVLISNQLTPYWSELMKNIIANASTNIFPATRSGVSMTYWPEENKLFVLVNGYLDNSGGTYTDVNSAGTMFVYNFVSQGWSIHKIDITSTHGLRNLTYFQDNIYFAANKLVVKMSETLYKDEDIANAGTYSAYDLELESAYVNLSSSKKFKKVEGFDMVIKTDFDGSNVGMIAAADFGRKVSAKSNVGLQSGYNNPFYSVGVDGNYIQYRLSGTSDTTSTDGYEIYSVGVSAR